MVKPTCTVPECDKPVRSARATLCPMHYHRQYRHGSVHRTRAAVGKTFVRKYRCVTWPDHPLAGKNGKVYEHRAVLYDAIGTGPHRCHWCCIEVDWLPKEDPRSLQVDHLNADGADNRLENLVPSCRACNTARAMQGKAEALRELGFWSGHDTVAGLKAPTQQRRPTVVARGADLALF